MQAGLPGQQRLEAKGSGVPGCPDQAGSLSAWLDTVREHLAWLASSSIVCSPEVGPSPCIIPFFEDLMLINFLLGSCCGSEMQLHDNLVELQRQACCTSHTCGLWRHFCLTQLC